MKIRMDRTFYQYQAVVRKNIDGDTARFDIDLSSLDHLPELLATGSDYVDLGFSFSLPIELAAQIPSLEKRIWRRNERIRFYGINCPEKNTPEGIDARDYVRRVIPVDSVVTLRTFYVSQSSLQDKYGRFLGIIEVDGMNLNDRLVQIGLAQPFMIG